MVVGFTTTHAISAYHHWCCRFESRLGRGVKHYVIKFVSDLRQVGGFLQVIFIFHPILMCFSSFLLLFVSLFVWWCLTPLSTIFQVFTLTPISDSTPAMPSSPIHWYGCKWTSCFKGHFIHFFSYKNLYSGTQTGIFLVLITNVITVPGENKPLINETFKF
jgi:hypothetical protein